MIWSSVSVISICEVKICYWGLQVSPNSTAHAGPPDAKNTFCQQFPVGF